MKSEDCSVMVVGRQAIPVARGHPRQRDIEADLDPCMMIKAQGMSRITKRTKIEYMHTTTEQQNVAFNADAQAERAEVWLDRAVADNDALAGLLSVPWYRFEHQVEQPGQAVYLLQQAVEKAVKALMVADGMDENALGKGPYGHDNLTIVLSFFERILEIPAYANAVGPLLGSISEDFEDITEISEHLRDAKGLVKETLAKELAVAPPCLVKGIVNWFETSRRDSVSNVRASLPSRFKVKVEPSADGSSSYVEGLMRNLDSVVEKETIPARHRVASEESTASFFAAVAPWLFQRTQQDQARIVTLDRDLDVSKLVRQGLALPHLMFLAALTFPHATTSCYPAPVGAPDDPVEAARCGQLGSQHYTRELGVVDQIRELNEQVKIVLQDLRPFLRGTSMIREATASIDE